MENNDAVLALASLAQLTRLQAFRELVRCEPDGLAAGDLAKQLSVPQNTLSSHLAILMHADMVTAERRSRSIIYRANLAALQRTVLFLVQDCCGGHPEVCGPLVDRIISPSPSGKPTSRVRA